MQRATLPRREAGSVEEDAGAVEAAGAALAVLDLADAALEALLAVLPLVVGELPGELLHPLLVGLLRVEGAVRAAAVVRAVLDDALAAGAEDAGPRRQKPGQVDTEDLVLVVGVDELDPLTREIEGHLRHWARLEPWRSSGFRRQRSRCRPPRSTPSRPPPPSSSRRAWATTESRSWCGPIRSARTRRRSSGCRTTTAFPCSRSTRRA